MILFYRFYANIALDFLNVLMSSIQNFLNFHFFVAFNVISNSKRWPQSNVVNVLSYSNIVSFIGSNTATGYLVLAKSADKRKEMGKIKKVQSQIITKNIKRKIITIIKTR